ncbi:MAG TPA: alpha-L-arabinofuranosidase C-terminal domain-containing protein [Pirellulales bacterium]|nr:alpha-L-arabinofuranosidase C-terminal domain-containing protein [Pirellulales bacterium]
MLPPHHADGRESSASKSAADLPSQQEGGDSSPLHRWEIVGNAQVTLDSELPLNGSRCARIITPGSGGGVAQNNLCIRRNDALRGSLWARGTANDGLLVRLCVGQSILAEQKLPAPGAPWSEIPVVLTPTESVDNATLQILTTGKAEFWLDQVSLMADSCRATGGFRPDLLQAIADLKPTTIRWPGGNFASGYHWKNGIGPQAKRVGKGSPDDMDPLALGLDEFMTLCRLVHASPVICVPLGHRDNSQLADYLQEAVDELEYCNGAPDSNWGKVRVANGHPEPYRVKYWEIDNELNLTSMKPEAYLQAVDSFATALRKRDPEIVIVGCGGGGTTMQADHGWALHMLDENLKSWDYFSIHHYENYSRGPIAPDVSKFKTGPPKFEAHISELRNAISKSTNPNLTLYLSEWNYMSTDWRTGLYAAGILNVLERNSDVVPMSCPALFLRQSSATSWDNALINFDNRTWYPAPNYVVMKLYRDHYYATRLTLEGDFGPLNAVATISDDRGEICVKAVNPSEDATKVNLEIGPQTPRHANLELIAPDSLSARNTLDDPRAVRPLVQEAHVNGNTVSFIMPRWSVAVIQVD